MEEEESKGQRNRIRKARRAELQREKRVKVLELALGPGLWILIWGWDSVYTIN